MMQALTALESKYGGVRGALLKKVREELEKLKPLAAEGRDAAPAASASTATGVRCDACGREMKMNGTDGRMRCMNGHTR